LVRECLTTFKQFANGKGSRSELEDGPPTDEEVRQFIRRIKELTAGAEDAWTFWSVQIETDPESYAD